MTRWKKIDLQAKRSDEDYMLTNVLLLTLSGKNIKKMGLTKYADFPCLWSNA